MEYECSPLSWEFCYQEEGIEDLRNTLLYTTLELEATIASANEEITRRECELIHVSDLLSKAIKERDEAQAKCHKLMQEKLQQQQQEQQHQQQQQQYVQTQQQHQKDTTTSQNEDEQQGQGGITASSDYEENNSSMLSPTLEELVLELAEKKPLPEKGKLLKAVVEAGPLLQTLLLAGPLPQWQHPPPQLNSIEIPPVAISSSPTTSSMLTQDTTKSFSFSNKRNLVPSVGADCPVSKCRKVKNEGHFVKTGAASSVLHMTDPA